MSKVSVESSLDAEVSDRAENAIVIERETSEEPDSTSTLIEFPGTSRAVPEWRKQLSKRVREVQERRAREAAETAAIQASAESVACALPSAQLELVPDREQPAMKPIVSKALERLERARQISAESEIAAIVDELIEAHSAAREQSKEARKTKLKVVPPPTPVEAAAEIPLSDSAKKPVRVITDGVEDQALSYFETCLSIPVVDFYPSRKPAGLWLRMAGGAVDLLLVGTLIGLTAGAMYAAGGDWTDLRTIELVAAIGLLLIFLYFTILIALTGRTCGMRLFSLRTIDRRTGLIPTGGQAIKRALGYVLSLVPLGLGFLYALLDRDGYTVHDRFSQTIVVHD